MRYYTEEPKDFVSKYDFTYKCDHPVYSKCTLFRLQSKGLAVIQQRYSSKSKRTWWSDIDPWLVDLIFESNEFMKIFNEKAEESQNGIYPTMTVRQLMWKMRMKPLKKEVWETCFDRQPI